MSICFTPHVFDDTHKTWIAPGAVRNNPENFELSLSNSNGLDILLALGLPPEPYGGPIAINPFAGRVTAALRRHLGRRSPELPTSTHAGTGSVTLLHLGRREGYVEERLGDLARLIQRSRAAGATHIAWG